MSQLDLALAAEVSPRHLSFLETGRAQPSQSMVLLLGQVLQMPLPERNFLLSSAGYAQVPVEVDLEVPEMSSIRHSLRLLLDKHDPNGALVFDRDRTVLLANRSAKDLLGRFVDPATLAPGRSLNLLRLLFHERYGFRRCVINWSHVARMAIQRLHREIVAGGDDGRLRNLLRELLDASGVPASWAMPDLDGAADVLMPIRLANDDHRMSLIFASTRFGSSADVTLSGLHMGTIFAADEATDRVLRRTSNGAYDQPA